MDTLQLIDFCNKQNVRNSQHFDKIIGAINDPDKHKNAVVVDNIIQLKYQFGSYKRSNRYDLTQ